MTLSDARDFSLQEKVSDVLSPEVAHAWTDTRALSIVGTTTTTRTHNTPRFSPSFHEHQTQQRILDPKFHAFSCSTSIENEETFDTHTVVVF